MAALTVSNNPGPIPINNPEINSSINPKTSPWTNPENNPSQEMLFLPLLITVKAASSVNQLYNNCLNMTEELSLWHGKCATCKCQTQMRVTNE